MPEIIQKLSVFLNYFGAWFDQNISSGLLGFLRALGNLFIQILQLFIDIIRWVIEHM
jgi:hypothetical protein